MTLLIYPIIGVVAFLRCDPCPLRLYFAGSQCRTWHRFNNRRQIGSYTGLCPGEYSSGNTRLQSCVTKHGNPRLRAALVELSWRLVRFQPNYKPIVKWRQILAKGALATGAARKKAIVAVARQLAVDLWRIKTGRLRAEELGLINQ